MDSSKVGAPVLPLQSLLALQFKNCPDRTVGLIYVTSAARDTGETASRGSRSGKKAKRAATVAAWARRRCAAGRGPGCLPRALELRSPTMAAMSAEESATKVPSGLL